MPTSLYVKGAERNGPTDSWEKEKLNQMHHINVSIHLKLLMRTFYSWKIHHSTLKYINHF